MKLTIDIPSALFTLAAVGIAAVLAGAAPIQGTASDRDVQATEDIGRRKASDLVCIEGIDGQESAPFVVPSGHILVLTGALNSSAPSIGWEFTIGPKAIAVYSLYGDYQDGPARVTATEYATGMPVAAGETVQIRDDGGLSTDRFLFGYLEPE
ncbi:MAG: hypothetical protein ISQ08_10800 [Planctomycetes bacterium]|nr:hypothetical protein [Planctomycetota bacterium]